MSIARTGEFKLALQTGSDAHFASVKVVVAFSENDDVLLSAAPDSVRGWREAIMAGAAAAVEKMKALSPEARKGLHVEVTEFVGLPIDTSDDDAKWATFMAVVRAFPEGAGIELVFEKQDLAWKVRG